MPVYTQLAHLNGNVLASVDVETTGRVPGYHEICSIAVLPLGPDIKPLSSVKPFYQFIRPEYPHRIDRGSLHINGLSLEQLMTYGVERHKSADLFEQWFNDLQLPVNRALTPLAHNWAYEKGFLIDWLGMEGVDHFFTCHPRDTMVTALFLNDYASFRGEQVPFNSVSLASLLTIFGVKNERPHDSLGDCTATAELYRRIVSHHVQDE